MYVSIVLLFSLYDTRRLDCLALQYKSLMGFSVTSDKYGIAFGLFRCFGFETV
jgi:hypothetical protein